MSDRLTEREIACLRLLNHRMDATPEQIGAAVLPDGGKTKRGRVTVGNRVADGLWDRLPPLATFVSRRVGYAITAAGRSALAQTDTRRTEGQDGRSLSREAR